MVDTTAGAGERLAAGPRRRWREARQGDRDRRAPRPGRRRGCGCWRGPSNADGTKEIVVVGEPLAQRERALGALHALLAIGGPLALLIASAVGYALAAAALRPVERMRRHAAAVTAAGTSERLPVPPANDEIGRLGRTLNEMLARLGGRRSSASGRSSRTRRTSCARRWRSCAPSSSSRCAASTRSEELEDALRSAAEEAERLSSLAEDLLVIARSDQGRLPVRPELLEAGDGARARRRALPDARQGRGAAARGRPVAGRAAATPTRRGSSRRSRTWSTTR